MEAALPYDQLPLFRRLPQPRGAKRKRRRSRLVVFIERVIGWAQLELGLPDPPAHVDPYADDEFDFPRHRIIAAAEAEAARTLAPPSIWALAARIASKSKRGQHRTPAFLPSAPGGLASVAVERRDGVTRNVGGMYPAGRWTPEKEEVERVRRAKQRPPKPVKGARTRSAKLLSMIGEPSED